MVIKPNFPNVQKVAYLLLSDTKIIILEYLRGTAWIGTNTIQKPNNTPLLNVN
jgi:hypothetical protein